MSITASGKVPSGLCDIAIIGMAAHLPGAQTTADYWRNLRAGVRSIRTLTPEELLANGESPARLRAENYVPSAVILEGFDQFDAEFFGLSPKEAAIMDPQHRQFLEVAWEALEDAAHPPESFAGRIGVYGGCGMGSYFYFNLCSNAELVRNTGMFLLRHTGNDKDFLTTRVSHIFDLKGPSVGVQTACSTSLVAVHQAVQALVNGECDMALAGGVTIELPHGRGYLYEKGEILSPDGACHAFDHRAQGTVFGSGAGCVVLRRLSDALADGDHIWAVIKGTAVNNDGAAKAGYLAPSVDGQADAIAEAIAVAGISAETVGYVECHGTGTYLGDPIEVAALTQAFRETSDAVGQTRIGSVKTNIGHLDTAAGVASLIKASLALHHGEIPPSLGYEAPNPAIDFETSPFRVNDSLSDFPRLGAPRRAGVNSLGVGGTNAHVVLQEAPERAPSPPADFPFVPLVLSARSSKALEVASARLAAHLRANPDIDLADVAFTLHEGRRAFDRRRVLVAASALEAAALLETPDRARVFTHSALPEAPEVVFMFPGGGAQYLAMGRDLYETEPVFRDWMDRGFAHLAPRHDHDLRALWMADPQGLLRRPSVQLPLIMMCEYALAQLWISWGVTPVALIGHSMGENTAACLAGVMAFEECLDLVHLRGRLFDRVPAGGMLSVPLGESDLAPRLAALGLDLASINAPGLCVVSGPDAGLAELARQLAADGIESQRIAIDIAAHSRMLDPILAEFGAFLGGIKLKAPQIPVISNRSGVALREEEARDPAYWVGHLRGAVRFAEGLGGLIAENPQRIYLEVGPGKALGSLAQANGVPSAQVMSSLRHADQQIADDLHFLTLQGRMWALGLALDWTPIWGIGPRARLPLPTYPFQRSPYFIEARAPQAAEVEAPWPERLSDLGDWGWQSRWRPMGLEVEAADLAELPPRTWLIFMDGEGIGVALVERLQAAGHSVRAIEAGDRYLRLGPDRFALAPEGGQAGYDALWADLRADDWQPQHIVHLWGMTGRESFRPGSSFFHRNLEQGFWSLYHLTRALAADGLAGPLHLTAVTTGAARVGDEAMPTPEKALIRGPLGVAPREIAHLQTVSLDLPLTAGIDPILEEALGGASGEAAWREGRRYVRRDRKQRLAETLPDLPRGAVVMITGGFGGISLTLARRLGQAYGARIGLVARQPLPPEADWAGIVARRPSGSVAKRIRALQELRASGIEVMALAADVGNLADMQQARADLQAAYGQVHMLIHAAGRIEDAPLLAKSELSASAVLAPKVMGLRVIDQVFADGDLARLVLFSSTSTATAPVGQVDYVAANAYLNAVAEARAGGRTQVLALNWGIWSDVGMASEALGPALPDPVAGLPMLAAVEGEETRHYHGHWTPDLWWLAGHRTRRGDVLLPGTGHIDLIGQVMTLEQGQTGFEIRDLDFLRPLEGSVPRDIRLILAPEGGVQVQARHEGGWLLCAEAYEARPLRRARPLQDLTALRARLPAQEQGDGLRVAQEAHLDFGPRWRVLQSRAMAEAEALAEVILPETFHGDLAAGHIAHPALLDIATGWAMDLIPDYRPDRLWVPAGYRLVQFWQALPAHLWSWVRLVEATGGSARFDITLIAPDGQIVAELQGFEMRRLDAALTLAPPRPSDLIPEVQGQTPSPAEARLRHNLTQGIPAEAGAEAFLRALHMGQGRITVSSLDLPTLVAQADVPPAAPQDSSEGFARPDLDSAYVAPRTDTESRLASFWQELLGVGQVGVEDSFFDLGGHSLIAVRLFAMIRKTWGVDFPISVLFEAPTIAEIAARLPQSDGEAPTATAAPAARFTHLVALHGGPERYAGRPLFLVAGMFGNVMNLRHLAQALGADRPVWGLQARGLFGDVPPHGDFVEAARDYLAELRQIQPHGPYLLGGFSGGGLIAWEMARQLEAAGEGVLQTILLDTPLPLVEPLSRGDRLRIRLGEWREQGPDFLRQWWQAKQSYKAQLAAKGQAVQEHQLQNGAIEQAFRAALPLYDLRPREGAVVLMRPALDLRWRGAGGRWISTARQYVYDDNLWSPYAPRLSIIEVPGDHDSMVLDPNVRVLAAKLRPILRASEEEFG